MAKKSKPASEPGPPARWGSPEFYTQTLAPPQPPAAPQWPPQAPAGSPDPGRDPYRGQGRDPRRGRLRTVLIGLGTFLAAAAIAAAVMLIAHPLQRGSAAAPAGSAPPGGTGSTSASEQAAQGLAALLAQSVTDRSSIVAAVTNVSRCGPNLGQDPQIFQNAVNSRQALLTRLASLPGRSELPASMLAALTGAWQNSIKADQDYAQWAQDEMSKGCTANNETDPGARAAVRPDAQATADKKAFASGWDPIATRYGLSAYQWNQL